MKRIQFSGLNLLFFLVLGILPCFLSCEKPVPQLREEKQTIAESESLPEKLFADGNKYNQDLLVFTGAVAKAIRENENLRKLIKSEALKMFDGDYDILMSDFRNAKVLPSYPSAKTGAAEISVGDLLQGYIGDSTVQSKGTKSSILDELIARYPFLQISVPVNAEKWDPENYTPAVTFLPYDYDESTTKELRAIDSDGKSLTLDAVNPPEEPVIVVGMNERIEMIEEPGIIIPPDPYDLTGIATESSIRLMWKMPYSATYENTTGYYVFRKSVLDFDYRFYGTVYGLYNKAYDDTEVETGKTYSYYVIAFHDMGETSAPSNYVNVTAPLKPKPVLSFDAIQNSKYEVELQWQNDNSQYIQETQLSKYVLGVTSSYIPLSSFTSDEHEYFDRDIEPGRIIKYKVVHYSSSLGESNPKYDLIHAPYRDVSQYSPVYIKQLRFTDWSIERWPAGKPEFYISVTNVDPVNKNPFIIQHEIICDYSRIATVSQRFYGKKVLDWRPGIWYDMLTFTAVEYDRPSGTMKVDVGVGFNEKNEIKNALVPSIGINYKLEFSDSGEKCNSAYLNYYDNPEVWLTFPNYGFQILVSESDL